MKRRKKKIVKLKRRAPRNPAGFGGGVAAGYGAYTIEGKMPTFKEYYFRCACS